MVLTFPTCALPVPSSTNTPTHSLPHKHIAVTYICTLLSSAWTAVVAQSLTLDQLAEFSLHRRMVKVYVVGIMSLY